MYSIPFANKCDCNSESYGISSVDITTDESIPNKELLSSPLIGEGIQSCIGGNPVFLNLVGIGNIGQIGENLNLIGENTTGNVTSSAFTIGVVNNLFYTTSGQDFLDLQH